LVVGSQLWRVMTMQVELSDGVPSAMPIQLRGILHESIWRTFEQKTNALFAEQKERTQSASKRCRPCCILACLGFAAPFVLFLAMFVGLAMDNSDEPVGEPPFFEYLPFAFGGFFLSMLTCMCMFRHLLRSSANIRKEFAPRLQDACNEVRQANPNVSVEMRREMRGVTRNGRGHLEYVLHIGVAGALGALAAAAGAPQMMQMQQFGGQYGGNYGGMPTPGGMPPPGMPGANPYMPDAKGFHPLLAAAPPGTGWPR